MQGFDIHMVNVFNERMSLSSGFGSLLLRTKTNKSFLQMLI